MSFDLCFVVEDGIAATMSKFLRASLPEYDVAIRHVLTENPDRVQDAIRTQLSLEIIPFVYVKKCSDYARVHETVKDDEQRLTLQVTNVVTI